LRRTWAGALFCLYTVLTLVLALSALGLRPFDSRACAVALWLAGLAAGWVAGKSLDGALPEPRKDAPAPRLSALGYAVGAAGALLGALTAATAVALPMGGYDALGYRLPALAQWLDAGRVAWVTSDDALRNGYPLGLEVLEASLSVVFGSTEPVELLGVACVALGGLALATFARELGVSRPGSALAGGLFLLVPIHVLNAPSGYADAAFSGLLVSMFYLAARWARGSREHIDLILLGACAALVTALKPHGFAFALLTLGAAFALRARADGLRRAGAQLAWVTCALLPGFFFCARNLAHGVSPLYPVELRVLGHVLFPGARLDDVLTIESNVPALLRALPRWLRPPFVWLQPYGPARAFDDRLAGLGYAFVAGGVPALGWLLAQLRTPERRRELTTLTFFLAATALCFALQPLPFWTRFTSWLWGAAALALALAFDALGRRARVRARAKSGRARGARAALGMCVMAAAVLAPLEAASALLHVKSLALYGPGLLFATRSDALADVAGVPRSFVRTALLGRRHVCRTPWTEGTNDANLDGIAAQLSPRPTVHVVEEQDWGALPAALHALGCEELLAIGHSPLRAPLPEFARSVTLRGFGYVDLISLPK
jgi:hypothetical protein